MFILRFFRSIAWLSNILLSGYSILIYWLSYFLPFKHWLAGFFMLTLPIVLLIHGTFLVFWFFTNKKRTLLSGSLLVLAFPFLERSFALHQTKDCEDAINVMSYNAMWFDVGNEDNEDTSQKIKDISLNTAADIKCFQEFFESESTKKYQILQKFKKQYPYKASLKDYEKNSIGLVTFSKYPILRHRSERFHLHNGLLETDILIGQDTIRIINVQFQSMGVRVNQVIRNRKNYAVAKHEAKNILYRLKDGFTDRAKQVDLLAKWIQASPYPVIVCGDFNEIPYGYAYGKINQSLKNAFAEAGNGFGFTYNKRPQFIRIDNQFCSRSSITVCDFELIDQIASDHYPIVGKYEIK